MWFENKKEKKTGKGRCVSYYRSSERQVEGRGGEGLLSLAPLD